MAQHTVVTMVDDITGEAGEDVKAVDFAFDGKAYEIDLATVSRDAFAELLAPYIASARRATVTAPRPGGKRSGSGKATSSNPDKARNQAAREWARAQSGRFEVAERGRLGKDVIEAWEAAGSPYPAGTSAPAPAQAEQNGSGRKRGRGGRAATTPTRPDAEQSAELADAQS